MGVRILSSCSLTPGRRITLTHPRSSALNQDLKEFWSLSTQDALARLGTAIQGLSTGSARERLRTYGPNILKPKKQATTLGLFLAQFKTPIILILIFAAILSYFLGDASTAIIILIIVFISGVLGFWQERGAADAIQKLLAVVQIKASVLRDGTEQEIPIEEVVSRRPGGPAGRRHHSWRLPPGGDPGPVLGRGCAHR